MSTLAVNTITNAAGGNTAQINGMTPTADSLQGFRNRIINGNMVIDQRNAGASGTASAYTVDRFNYVANQASKGTWQQNAGSVTPPTGFSNYLGFTSSSAYSVLTGDYFAFTQRIEGYNFSDLGWGTADAKTITLSFWVRSSLTGTFGGALYNGTPRSYPFSYTISSADTWTNISITIAGDTSGTYATNNTTAVQVLFGLGVGSTYSGTAGSWSGNTYFSATGAVSVVGTDGATFYITGVQLEAGSVATPFERRPYSTELQLAQRYFQTTARIMPAVINSSATSRRGYYPRTVTMRATPTETGTQGAGGTVAFFGSAFNTGIDVDGATAASESNFTNYTASAEL
jgi:hypothetical protein